MPGIERRLSVLEAQVHVNGNGHSHSDNAPRSLTLEEFYELFHGNNLRFDAPGHCILGHGLGPASPGYDSLVELAQMINDSMQQSAPCLFVPLTTEQVDLAKRALDAGMFKVDETWGYGHIHHFCTHIRADWSVCDRRNSKCYSFPGLEGQPFDLHDFAHTVDIALECAIAQLSMPNTPPGISKTLEFLGAFVEWYRVHHHDEYDEP